MIAAKAAVWMAPTFVVIWASGFVVARLAAPDSTPLLFLSIRFGLAALVLGLIALLFHKRLNIAWPSSQQAYRLMVSAFLIHTVYLSGVWVAVKLGMSAGTTALVVNLQPALTAVLVLGLGERVGVRQWFGLLIGLVGVLLVVWHKLSLKDMPTLAIALCFLALLGITFGTLIQKYWVGPFDLRSGTLIQYLSAAMVTFLLCWIFEVQSPLAGQHAFFRLTLNSLIAMAWSVLALSIAAIFMMFRLVQLGSATRVTRLMYWVPPVTAIQAWILFGEPISGLTAIGMLIVALGVWLAGSKPSRNP